MSSMMALPREGHLQQLYRIFAFLKCKHNYFMVFDHTEPDIDLSAFRDKDWSSTPYDECRE